MTSYLMETQIFMIFVAICLVWAHRKCKKDQTSVNSVSLSKTNEATNTVEVTPMIDIPALRLHIFDLTVELSADTQGLEKAEKIFNKPIGACRYQWACGEGNESIIWHWGTSSVDSADYIVAMVSMAFGLKKFPLAKKNRFSRVQKAGQKTGGLDKWRMNSRLLSKQNKSFNTGNERNAQDANKLHKGNIVYKRDTGMAHKIACSCEWY